VDCKDTSASGVFLKKMPWRRVRSGRRVDGTDCGDDGSAPGRERDMVEVPELWGGGNAASLMEARGMARKQIREEIANARHGFAGVESQREEERIPEAGGDYTGNGSLRGDVDHAKNEPAEDKTMHEQMKTSPEEIAMLRRIGLNHAEVCSVLCLLCILWPTCLPTKARPQKQSYLDARVSIVCTGDEGAEIVDRVDRSARAHARDQVFDL
jgi:hypothetical protein